jgi:hypothetical protein
MRRFFALGAVVLGLGTAAVAVPAEAAPVRFGAQVSLADDADVGLGVRLVWGLESLGRGFGLVTSFDYFFPDQGGEGGEVDYWEVNGNLTYTFSGRDVHPYVGGGLDIANLSVGLGGESDTHVGLNVLGGAAFGKRQRFFVELKFEIEGGEQFVACAGVRF